jgi:hypothetical protein
MFVNIDSESGIETIAGVNDFELRDDGGLILRFPRSAKVDTLHLDAEFNGAIAAPRPRDAKETLVSHDTSENRLLVVGSDKFNHIDIAARELQDECYDDLFEYISHYQDEDAVSWLSAKAKNITVPE